MSKRAERPTRRRCTECRLWFKPAPSAAKTQHVCGPSCRARRRRKLAQARRRRELACFRVDNRERQQVRRKLRRESAAAATCTEAVASAAPPSEPTAPRMAPGAGCHAPASAAKGSELQREVLTMWDELQAMSRASLVRALPGIMRRIERSGETGTAR